LNAALLLLTEMSPARLKFEHLRPIEAALGRIRTENRNAPRTIDLDIALYDEEVIRDPDTGLLVPDPEIVSCAHLALPLADLDPEHRHPTDGRTLGEIARSFEGQPGIHATDLYLDVPTPP
jgi:7,8-dihydro-6-hydroxymethylpterin-pyrophosphokinase